jgi:hypothetical protein
VYQQTESMGVKTRERYQDSQTMVTMQRSHGKPGCVGVWLAETARRLRQAPPANTCPTVHSCRDRYLHVTSGNVALLASNYNKLSRTETFRCKWLGELKDQHFQLRKPSGPPLLMRHRPVFCSDSLTRLPKSLWRCSEMACVCWSMSFARCSS